MGRIGKLKREIITEANRKLLNETDPLNIDGRFDVDSSGKRFPFRNEYLTKDSNIGKYELYLDGGTCWGITFPNGYMEVEEGPHDSVGYMNGKINGIEVSAEGYNVPRIPGKYWMGEMSKSKLSNFFDSVISGYDVIAKGPFRYKM